MVKKSYGPNVSSHCTAFANLLTYEHFVLARNTWNLETFSQGALASWSLSRWCHFRHSKRYASPFLPQGITERNLIINGNCSFTRPCPVEEYQFAFTASEYGIRISEPYLGLSDVSV